MLFEDMMPMTERMEVAYGTGWGGFFKDDGTTAYIALGTCDDEPCVVVLGCLDGQWGAECSDAEGYIVAAGYGQTPQEALDDIR